LDFFKKQAHEIADDVNAGRTAVADIIGAYTQRTSTLSKKLNTHLYWAEERVAEHAAAQAKRIELARKNGQTLPLAGVPVVIKDNICVEGQPLTCASKILTGHHPVYNATVIEKLDQAGAVFFGKANLDEFAMGSSNENSAFGTVKNPWNTDYVPGGSSGGSAAAVGAAMAPVALGSDTGGSVRQPASFCGVVGFKPTYGTVSRYGLVAFGSSLDQIGPICRTVRDTALVYDVIKGQDPRDSTSEHPRSPNLATMLKNIEARNESKPLAGLRVGVVKECFQEGLDGEVLGSVKKAIEQLASLGAEIKEASLPNIRYSIATYYIIATAEASSNLSRYDGVRYGLRSFSDPGKYSLEDLYVTSRSEGFGREVKQRIMLGAFTLSSGYYDAYYHKATRARQMITNDFVKAFGHVDVLLSPTAPTTAFKIGQKVGDPLSMYLNDIYTIGVNLAGIPAISIPCGFDQKGLPIGLQLMAAKFDDESLFKGAFCYEQSTRWYEQRQPGC